MIALAHSLPPGFDPFAAMDMRRVACPVPGCDGRLVRERLSSAEVHVTCSALSCRFVVTARRRLDGSVEQVGLESAGDERREWHGRWDPAMEGAVAPDVEGLPGAGPGAGGKPKRGRPRGSGIRIRKDCEVEGCETRHSVAGFCGMHYARWLACGKPERRAWNQAGGLKPWEWEARQAAGKGAP